MSTTRKITNKEEGDKPPGSRLGMFVELWLRSRVCQDSLGIGELVFTMQIRPSMPAAIPNNRSCIKEIRATGQFNPQGYFI